MDKGVESKGLGSLQNCKIEGSADEKFQEGKDALLAGDYNKARKIFLVLAREKPSGRAGPKYALGEMHRLGLGVPNSFHIARIWYRRAMDDGSSWAKFRLGLLLWNSGSSGNKDRGMALLKESAREGVPHARFALGVICAGKHSRRGFVEAYSWISMVHDADVPESSSLLQKLRSGMTESDISRAVSLSADKHYEMDRKVYA